MVVWNVGFPSQLRFARIAGDGEILDPGGILVAPIDLTDGWVTAACTEAMCMVVWERDFDIRGARISLAGTVIDATPLDLGRGISPRVTAMDSGFMVSAGQSYVVPEMGRPLLAELPSSAGLGSWDVRWDGQHFVMAWSQQLGEQILLHVGQFDRQGRALGEPTLLATLDRSVFVDVAHDGNQSIVTWWPWLLTKTDRISAARYTDDGTLLDPGGVDVVLDPSMSPLRRVVDGTNGRFLVVEQVEATMVPDRGFRLAARWATIEGSNPAADDGAGAGCGCRSQAGDSGAFGVGAIAVLMLRRRRRLNRRN